LKVVLSQKLKIFNRWGLWIAYVVYQQQNIQQSHLSITHEKDYALAFVVFTGQQ